MSSLRIRNLLRYTSLMRSRASQIAVTLVLLTCLICPLVETFDNWDHTIQTGNDTEYALVVLALFFDHLLDWVTQDDSCLPLVFRTLCCYRDCRVVWLVVLCG